MVHAEASNFEKGVTKDKAYEQVLEQAQALFDGQRNWVCNLANTASLLWHMYHALDEPSSKVNWAGFYVLDETNPKQLILGPFQGKVACQTIAIGRGVCGTAASWQETMLVPDVEKFPGHIACDSDSASEVVVPLIKDGKTVAIIDIDCAVLKGFGGTDKRYLEKLAKILVEACDWPGSVPAKASTADAAVPTPSEDEKKPVEAEPPKPDTKPAEPKSESSKPAENSQSVPPNGEPAANPEHKLNPQSDPFWPPPKEVHLEGPAHAEPVW